MGSPNRCTGPSRKAKGRPLPRKAWEGWPGWAPKLSSMNHPLSRRALLAAAAGFAASPALAFESRSPRRKKRLAIVTTVWRPMSHAHHMGDRFLVGYPIKGGWHQPD